MIRSSHRHKFDLLCSTYFKRKCFTFKAALPATLGISSKQWGRTAGENARSQVFKNILTCVLAIWQMNKSTQGQIDFLVTPWPVAEKPCYTKKRIFFFWWNNIADLLKLSFTQVKTPKHMCQHESFSTKPVCNATSAHFISLSFALSGWTGDGFAMGSRSVVIDGVSYYITLCLFCPQCGNLSHWLMASRFFSYY